MKITHYIYIALAIILTGCSNIGEDERLIYVGPSTPVDTDTIVKPDDPDQPVVIKQNVLIEDFTGQKCVNCPNATEIIDALLSAYGDTRIVPVAIHSGTFGVAVPKGLMTTIGQEYFPTGHGQPVGRINRGEAIDDYSTWGSIVATEMAKQAKVDVTLTTAYDASTRSITVNATATVPASSGTVTGKYQVWLTEDNITAVQYMPDGSSNKSYVHNHVFRDAINGTWGEEVSLAASTDPVALPSYTYTLSDSYNADNCSIVAFIYNDSGVLQVTKSKVVLQHVAE